MRLPSLLPCPRRPLAPALTALGLVVLVGSPAHAGPLGKEWQSQPFVRPAVGASSWSSNGQTAAAATVGVRAGINYWEQGRKVPKLTGQARVAGDYLLSASDVSGWEVRVGNFIGPTWRHVGLSFGPDLFHNQYTVAGTVLAPVTGLAAPLIGSAQQGAVSAYVGLEPSWYMVGERPGVDWAEDDVPFGFGDEFRYLAGASVAISELRVGVNYQYRITSGGTESGFGLALGYNPPATTGKVRGGKKKKKG